MDKFIVHLSVKDRPGYSKRAVKYRMLDPMEVEQVLINAGKVSDKETTIFEFDKIKSRMGTKQMVLEVSEPCDDPLKAKFKKVTLEDLDTPGDFFTAKDWSILEKIYRDNHDVDYAEVNAIVGKALPVAED